MVSIRGVQKLKKKRQKHGTILDLPRAPRRSILSLQEAKNYNFDFLLHVCQDPLITDDEIGIEIQKVDILIGVIAISGAHIFTL